MAGSFAALQGLRLVGNVLLARVLFPEAFGLMGLVMAIVTGLQMFTDVGVAPALMRSGRGDDRVFRDTAWTLGVIRGLAVFVVTVLVARPIGDFFDPRLSGLLPVVGTGALVGALGSTSLVMLNRQLDVGRLSLLELVSAAVGMVAMVGLAWMDQGIWSLVWGNLVGVTVKTAGSWMLVPGYRDRPCLEREAVTEIIRFGRWVLVSTAVTFVATQVDRLLLGKLLTMEELGLYSIAFGLMVIPRELIGRLTTTVQMPVLSRCVRMHPQDLQTELDRTRGPLLLMSMGMSIASGLMAGVFISVCYDARYAGAIPLAVALAVPMFLASISQSSGFALFAVGDSRALAIVNGVRAASAVLAPYVGFRLGGLEGFIGGMSVSVVAGHLVQCWCLWRHRLSVLKRDVLYAVAFLVLLWVPITLQAYWGRPDSPLKSGAVLALIASLVVVTMCGLGLIRFRGLSREMRRADGMA